MITLEFDSSLKPYTELGALVFTQGVDALVRSERLNPFHYFGRHLHGDWGDICNEDRVVNEDALISGERLMSVYEVEPGLTIWIITEADRSVTTILLPNEY